MMFPKKVKKVGTISVEEYKTMIANNPKMLPKKSMLNPAKSKTMKAVCSEDELQCAVNELIDLKKWFYVRFENWFMAWMRKAPIQMQKHFFSQVGGRFPDNLIMIELGKGMFLSVKLEIKTEDKHGNAIGRLHGKQKNFANAEQWFIARNTKQAEEVLNNVENIAQKVKKIIDSENI